MVIWQPWWICLQHLPWVRSASGVRRVQHLPEHGPHTARAHVVPEPAPALQSQDKGAHQGWWGALQEPSHQQMSQDLGTSPLHPIRAVLVSYGIWVCFVFFPQDQDLLHVLTVLPPPLPSAISPGKPQRKKVRSQTVSLSLLTEDQSGLTVPFQRKKKNHFPMKFVPATAPQSPFTPPPTHRQQTGEPVILSVIPMS